MFISSSSNPKIQRVRALLNQRQARQEQRAFVVEGVRLIEEALAARWEPELALYTDRLSERGLQMVDRFRELKCEVAEVPDRLMDQITGTETPQGLLAIFRQRDLPLPPAPDFLLIADNLRDPGNLGTLLRSAAAAGAQAALLSPGTTEAYAPKVLRAGMGAHFRLPIHHRGWEEIRALCKQRPPAPLTVYLADAAGGIPCWDLDLRAPLALIVSSEADGPSPKARELADQAITIPMPGVAESLNAAVAASILLFEVVRQRRNANP